MVHFVEHISSGQKYLVILKDKDQPIKNGLSLLAEEPMSGPLSPVWPDLGAVFPHELSTEKSLNSNNKVWILKSSIHNKAPNRDPKLTLGRRLIEGKTRWNPIMKIPGEFTFTPCYWEWLEFVVGRNEQLLYQIRLFNAVMASLYTYDRNNDVVRAFFEGWCPTTNTLHTAAGELSISLWDLWTLGGLPIKGKFYEEVIPCLKELTGSRNKRKYLPKSCEHLFEAYHLIVSSKNERGSSSKTDAHVSIGSWISFWFNVIPRYEKPSARKQRKATRSKITHNPDGTKIKPQDWTSKEHKLFQDLGVADEWREKTYLAAFLSCWLCIFVFPRKGAQLLHPGVFRVASLMADGQIFSLAVPTLANIYHGLGRITEATNPIGRMEVCLPMHYIYGWLAHYFNTHYLVPVEVRGPKMVDFSGEGGSKYFGDFDARELIHKGATIIWHANVQGRNKHELLEDNNALSFSQSSYFPSLRSSYLSSRCGDLLIIESYSPYRFSRQFGFYQDVPNDLGGDPPALSLENILRHWRICTKSNTLSRVYLPARTLDPHTQVSQQYKNWWLEKHGDYYEENAHKLVGSVIPSPARPKLPKSTGGDHGGKKIRLPENDAIIPEQDKSEHGESSHSSTQDHCWKIAPKKSKVSPTGLDNFFEGVASASQFPTQPLLLSPLDDVHLEIEEQHSEESLTGPDAVDNAIERASMSKLISSEGATTSYRPLQISGSSQRTQQKPTVGDPEASQFCADLVISNFKQQAAIGMWEAVQQKIARTSFENVPSLVPETHKILNAISGTQTNNLTFLQNLVGDYFKRVETYNKLAFTYSTQLTSTSRDHQLGEKNSELENVQLVESQLLKEKDVLQQQFTQSSLEIKKLEAKLRNAKAEFEKVSSLIDEKEKTLEQQGLEVTRIRDEISSIECAPIVDEEDAKTLAVLHESLEATREELRNYKWKP